MNIKEYIASGVLEAYVMGAATEEETAKLLYVRDQFPEVQKALEDIEVEMERIAQQMAITPPPGTWEKIEARIDDLILSPEFQPLQKYAPNEQNSSKSEADGGPHFIEVEAESNQMRINKAWKWVFAAVFVLGKIFLGFAIYFYLENRQAQEQIQELKTELRQVKRP